MDQPTESEWRRLFAAAQELKDLQPWRQMWDDEMFGVVDPASGEIAWCCIIGALGENLGLFLLFGAEGLATHALLQSDVEPADMPSFPRGLVCTFDDRKELLKEDLATIKALGLRFRGRQAWPCFRSLRPGYTPWLVDAAEARFLATALEQAVFVCRRVCDGELDLLADPERPLVRAPVAGGVGWEDRWEAPAGEAPVEPPLPAPSAERLTQVTQACPRTKARWECDEFELPAVSAGAGERPFFPRVFLVVDARSGLVVHQHLSEPPFPREALQEQFLAAAETTHALPRQIVVGSDRVRGALEPAARALGVKVRLQAELPAFDAFVESLPNL